MLHFALFLALLCFAFTPMSQNAVCSAYALSRAGQYTSHNDSKSVAPIQSYWKLRSRALTACELPCLYTPFRRLMHGCYNVWYCFLCNNMNSILVLYLCTMGMDMLDRFFMICAKGDNFCDVSFTACQTPSERRLHSVSKFFSYSVDPFSTILTEQLSPLKVYRSLLTMYGSSQTIFFFFFRFFAQSIFCGYSSCLGKMSIHNICFPEEIRKIIIWISTSVQSYDFIELQIPRLKSAGHPGVFTWLIWLRVLMVSLG